MKLKIRQNFFRLFAIFFILVSPFLAIYSLGFDLDLEQQGLANTLSITVETIPRDVEIYSEDRLIKRGSGELKARDNQLIPLEIKYDGYLEENFDVWAQPDRNTTARLTNMSLMPSNPVDLNRSESFDVLTILTDNLVLISQDNNLYMQIYSFGGLQGGTQLISKPGYIQVQAGRWEVLDDELFWSKEQNLVLYKFQNRWQIFDLRQLPFNAVSITSLIGQKGLLLNSEGELWSIDFAQNQITFLDQKIQGMAFTSLPDSVWFWKDRQILRLDRPQLTLETNIVSNIRIYAENDVLLNSLKTDLSSRNFKAIGIFQGMAFLVDQKVFYIPDFDKSQWQALADQVEVISSDSNTLFWLDTQQNLFSYNLFLKNTQFLGKVNLTGDKNDWSIYYYFPWRRVFVYSKSQVYTVWFDKEILNTSVVRYYPKEWIKESFCRTNVIDRFQFCVQQGDLKAYSNTRFW